MKKVKTEKLNAELQKELSEENDKYYGDLIVYTRVKTIFRDSQATEELMLEILQDIIEAQNSGMTAEEYFGKDPKQIADEMIVNLPVNILDTIKLGLIGLFFYMLAVSIPAMLVPDSGIDVGKYILAGVWAVIVVMGFLWLLGNTLYQRRSVFSNLLLAAIAVIGFISEVCITQLISTPFVVIMSNTAGILTILFLLCILGIIFYMEQDKKTWIPFIPTVLFLSIFGILLRTNIFASVLNTKAGKTILAIVVLLVLVIQYIIMILVNKKRNV